MCLFACNECAGITAMDFPNKSVVSGIRGCFVAVGRQRLRSSMVEGLDWI